MPTIDLKKLCPEVEENSDFLVFYVESSQKGKIPYRVDLQKFAGNGHCDCASFQLAKSVNGKTITKKRALMNGAMPSPQLECKHISKAKRYLFFKMINAVIEQREKDANANKQLAKAERVKAKEHCAPSIPGPARPSHEAGGGTPGDAPWPTDADCPY